MKISFIFILAGLASYLLGAIPFGYIIARYRGIDIRKTGSGNIGATNVFRSIGKLWGIVTFFCDVTKGFIASFFFPILINHLFSIKSGPEIKLLCACFSVAGHNWPVYLKFKGGKGVATSTGALFGIVPKAMTIGLVFWVIFFLITRYVSVASIITAIILAICSWIFYIKESILIPIVLTSLALLVIFRHHSNIKRLINGTENRFEFSKTGK